MFWPDVVKWCIHIQNRSPTTVVKNMTLEEAWSGKKPVVGNFKNFGCLAHAHIPDQKRTKLTNKSRPCIFLGVSDESKAWKLYDPISKSIIISIYVVFEEEECWNLSQSEQTQQ